MSKDIKAFPYLELNVKGEAVDQHLGMTLRDYFAGQALVGLSTGDWYMDTSAPERIAKSAYSVADAMLAERGKQND